MPLTDFQREICRVIAANRIDSGESYVAGGAALNEWLKAPRLSRDLDLFHDSEQALQLTWDRDRALLQTQGYDVEVIRERPYFVEAQVSRDNERSILEWAQDSVFRFFPLVAHPDFGLSLHPFDLATNKTLALVGRLEARDWVDLIAAAKQIQPLGYLAWAACGKDPGFSPSSLLSYAARAHYSEEEVGRLSFSGPAPDARELSRSWRLMIEEARAVVGLLPAASAGCCILNSVGELFTGSRGDLEPALAARALVFRSGSVRGALPQVSRRVIDS